MPRPAPLRLVRRKRGNPNWGCGRALKFSPAMPTEFEMQVRELGLTAEKYATSRQLKNWCERNKNHHYIPEWLLKAWNIKVDLHFSDAA